MKTRMIPRDIASRGSSRFGSFWVFRLSSTSPSSCLQRLFVSWRRFCRATNGVRFAGWFSARWIGRHHHAVAGNIAGSSLSFSTDGRYSVCPSQAPWMFSSPFASSSVLPVASGGVFAFAVPLACVVRSAGLELLPWASPAFGIDFPHKQKVRASASVGKRWYVARRRLRLEIASNHLSGACVRKSFRR